MLAETVPHPHLSLTRPPLPRRERIKVRVDSARVCASPNFVKAFGTCSSHFARSAKATGKNAALGRDAALPRKLSGNGAARRPYPALILIHPRVHTTP
jgi:hypothetical protein